MILICQGMYGMERGNQIRAIVEGAVEGPCPCLSGKRCPLVSERVGDLPIPRPRSA